jgi:hypothetical protein
MESVFKQVVDWEKVQSIIKEIHGRHYSVRYLMGIRNGHNPNKDVRETMKIMGIIEE